MSGTTLSRGNILVNLCIGPTLTPVAVAANITAEQNFTIIGLQTGDQMSVSAMGAQTAGIFVSSARCIAPNIMTVGFGNLTSGSLTPVSGQYLIEINRQENITLPTNAT